MKQIDLLKEYVSAKEKQERFITDFELKENLESSLKYTPNSFVYKRARLSILALAKINIDQGNEKASIYKKFLNTHDTLERQMAEALKCFIESLPDNLLYRILDPDCVLGIPFCIVGRGCFICFN